MNSFFSSLFAEENPLARYLQENDTEYELDDCETEESDADLAYTISINALVFLTVWGISAVVDPNEFKKSFRSPPIYAGVTFQFILMPFIGFIAVSIFPLEPLEAVALLILCASPGGSFSNWWCNLFNADLALSVSMTSLSTVAAIGMLPLNIVIYVTLAYERTQDFAADELDVDFADLGLTLGLVVGAIILGLMTGLFFPQYQYYCNIIGNICGLGNVTLGVFASADTCDGTPPWRQPFYPLWIATAFPLLVALIGVLIMGSLLRLEKPQRVAIALETAYQNTSIALAYTISQGNAGREAAGVPVIYGGYEAGFFFLFMVGSWKAGWTYAPPEENVFTVMIDNYQPGGDNHKRLFPGYYGEKDESVKHMKAVRESITSLSNIGLGRKPSSIRSAGEPAVTLEHEDETEVDGKHVKENAQVQGALDLEAGFADTSQVEGIVDEAKDLEALKPDVEKKMDEKEEVTAEVADLTKTEEKDNVSSEKPSESESKPSL